MRKIYTSIVKHRKLIIIIFLVVAAICGALKGFVAVDYDMKDYLPEDTSSTVSLNKMNEEFDGGIPNARVMIKDVSVANALDYKSKLESIDGVKSVIWLDDATDVYQPLETLDTDTVETYYVDGNALFTLTIDEDKNIETVKEIRKLIGDDNAITGDAVTTAVATESTVTEISKIATFAVLFVLFVLLLTTNSFAEPFIILAGLGVAVIINAGSNLIFGEISFVTNAAGNILQLAVSLDYSVFLLHRYEECLKYNNDEKSAMVDALEKSTNSIFSSGITTVIGFLALIFMRFGIGPDLGLALAKGIAISLITVFVFMPSLILVTHKIIVKTRHKRFLPSFNKFGTFVTKAMIPMLLIFTILIVPSYLASNSNSFNYGSTYIFGTDTQVGKDAQDIENVFGKSDTYALLVPKGDTAKETELSNALHDLSGVKSIVSFVDKAGAEVPYEYLDEATLAKLESDNYSRMVITVEADADGEEAFNMVKAVRQTAEKYYPNTYYLAGNGVSTYDLMDTITADMVKVNLIAIGAVFVVLLLTMKSISLPLILVIAIETAIWINLSVPYFNSSTIFYISYLIISSIQLGATVDYAILFTDRYCENRRTKDKLRSIKDTVSSVTVSVLTSGSVLAVVGFLLGAISSHGVLSQLGTFLGRGSILSMVIVLFVLPCMLYVFDWVIRHTTKNCNFLINHKEKKNEK